MAHPLAPKRFEEREREITARAANEDPMRILAEMMMQHVCWQAEQLERRVYHPGRRQPKDILALAHDGQLFVLHRELSDAFVRIARVHAQLDCIEGKGVGGEDTL